MSEATGEQIQLEGLTTEQQEQVKERTAYMRKQGAPQTAIKEAISSFIQELKQKPSVPEEGTSDSEARRREAATGKSTIDFLPEELKEEPVIKNLKRQVTEIGENIDRIQAEMGKLDEYNPPQGKKVDVIKPKKGEPEIYKFNINWAEYGWGDEEKAQAKRDIMKMFHLDAESSERAAEALLLAGYTAHEVIERMEINKEKNASSYGSNGNMFGEIFSDDTHRIYNSSMKIVFNQESRFNGSFEQQPRDIEDLAWQMSWAGNAGRLGGRWMVGSKNSLFDIRMKTAKERQEAIDRNGDHSWGKYTINEANFREWFLDQTNVLYDIHGPDGQINAMDDIKIDKGVYSRVTFREMIEKQNQLFVSEDMNTQYMQMWLQLQFDESNFITLYTNDVIYRQASKQGLDEWIKKYEEMTFTNFLTKLGYRSNMLQRLLTGAEKFEEGRTGMHGDTYLSDNKLGTAFLEMTLAFYNLGDFDKLQEILGPNSKFFTWEGWDTAIKAVASATAKRPRGAVRLDKDAEELLNKAFKGGKSNTLTDDKSKEAFQKFINLLGTKHLHGAFQELFLTRAVQLSVQERFGITGDDVSAGLDLYAAQAWFFNRFMGGMARNDIQMAEHKGKKGTFHTPNPSVHDKMSELLNMDANRRKYASEGGGKPFGNIYTLGQFKAAIVDPMNGITTQDGISILKIFEAAHSIRVFQQTQINALKARYGFDTLAEGDGKKRIEALIEQEEEKHSRDYMKFVAEQVQFRNDQQIEYVQVHLKPGKDWAHRVVNGEGLDFNAFTNFDPWSGGATVKREVFIKEIQKKMIGTIRDMYKKYNYMNFDDDVRIPFYDPKTGKHGFRDGKLGEQEFGYDLLNRKEFWKKENGKYVMKNGRHVIDYKLVNKERTTLMKQVFMMELQADMYSHQKMNSGDLRFPPSYYLNLLDTLKKMPGNVIIDEFRAHGYDISEEFWTKEDFKWLEKRALNGGPFGSGKFPFMVKWFFTSLADRTDKEGMGFGKMFSIIMKEAFSGGPTT